MSNLGFPDAVVDDITFHSMEAPIGVSTNIPSSYYSTRPPKTKAVITVEDYNIRYRVDGGAVDVNTGHIATTDDVIILESFREIQQFNAIGLGDTATLMITFTKE